MVTVGQLASTFCMNSQWISLLNVVLGSCVCFLYYWYTVVLSFCLFTICTNSICRFFLCYCLVWMLHIFFRSDLQDLWGSNSGFFPFMFFFFFFSWSVGCMVVSNMLESFLLVWVRFMHQPNILPNFQKARAERANFQLYFHPKMFLII